MAEIWDNEYFATCRQMLMTEQSKRRQLRKALSWVQHALQYKLYDTPEIIEEIVYILEKEKTE